MKRLCMSNKKKYFMLFFFLLSLKSIAGNEMYLGINIHVTTSTCDIYGVGGDRSNIELNFKDLVVPLIDGNKYEQTVYYSMNCSSFGPALKFFIDGPTANFNPEILRSNEEELGFKFRVNSEVIPINKPYFFQFNNSLPTITVTPVVNDKNKIVSGNFKAIAILRVEYQ